MHEKPSVWRNIWILLLECYPSIEQLSGSTIKASRKDDLTDMLSKDRKQDLSVQTSKNSTFWLKCKNESHSSTLIRTYCIYTCLPRILFVALLLEYFYTLLLPLLISCNPLPFFRSLVYLYNQSIWMWVRYSDCLHSQSPLALDTKGPFNIK